MRVEIEIGIVRGGKLTMTDIEPEDEEVLEAWVKLNKYAKRIEEHDAKPKT